MEEYKCEKCRKPLEKSYYACDYCIQAARIAELEAACKLENELKTAGSLRELKLMGEVDELRKQLADLRGDRDTLAREVREWRTWFRACQPSPQYCLEVGRAMIAVDDSQALTRAGKESRDAAD